MENTSWATAIRQSLWLYPIIEIVHISGIVLLAGAAFMFDLRLLGCAKNLPVTRLASYLLPWSRKGLLFVVPSGILLFITNATTLGIDPTFQTKITLLILAGANAFFFHRFTFRSATSWNVRSSTPPAAKTAAILSIILWLSVIACGRLLAY